MYNAMLVNNYIIYVKVYTPVRDHVIKYIIVATSPENIEDLVHNTYLRKEILIKFYSSILFAFSAFITC